MSVSTRAELHELVEDLAERDLDRARQALKRLRGGGETVGSLEWLLDNAPIDGEPTTPEEEEGLIEAREQAQRGEIIPADEIKRGLLA